MPSDKIKSKDLQYESSLPPFLQRLRAQQAGRGDTDRHEFQVARPKRAKDPNEDDGPTVVDESGETVSKEEYEKLTKAESEGRNTNRRGSGADVGGAVTGSVDEAARLEVSGALLRKDAVTDGLTSKKRKAARIIGGDDKGSDKVKYAKKVQGGVIK